MTNADEIVTIADDVRVVPVGDDVTVLRVAEGVANPADDGQDAASVLAPSSRSETTSPRRGDGGHGLLVTAAVWVIFTLHRLWLKLPPDSERGAGDSAPAPRAPDESRFETGAPRPDRRRGTPVRGVTADEDSTA